MHDRTLQIQAPVSCREFLDASPIAESRAVCCLELLASGIPRAADRLGTTVEPSFLLCSATPRFLLNRLRASPESQRSVHELIPFLTARNVRLPVCRTMLNLLFILAGLSLATSLAQSKWRNLQRMFPAFLPPGSSSAGQVWESGQSQFPGPQSGGWALAVFGGWLHRGQMPLPFLTPPLKMSIVWE